MIFSTNPIIGITISSIIMMGSAIILFKNISNKIKDKILRKKIDRLINQNYLSDKKQEKDKKQKFSSIYLDIQKKKKSYIILLYLYLISSLYILIVYFDYILILYSTIIFIISILGSNIVFKSIINRKNKRFIKDFPDVLDLMARSILSGHSIIDSINIVVDNSSGILAEEFNNISNNISLGSSLQESLDFSRKHIKINEFHYFCVITYVQQQTGGNITILLTNLANSLRKKLTVEKKIRSLSSEPIASAVIVGTLPLMVISIIWLLNPDYLNPLIQQRIGQLIILGCILWQIIGVIIMRKIIKIEI